MFKVLRFLLAVLIFVISFPILVTTGFIEGVMELFVITVLEKDPNTVAVINYADNILSAESDLYHRLICHLL